MAQKLTRNIKDCSSKIQQCILQPSIFMEKILNYTPHQYNVSFLDDLHDRLIYRASRQVGKSTMVAVKVLHMGLFMRYLKPVKLRSAEIIIISTTLPQSIKLLDRMRELVYNSTTFQQYYTNIKKSQFQIKFFDNDGTTDVYAIAAGKKSVSQLGYTAQVIILDEAGELDDNIYHDTTPSGATTDMSQYITGNPRRLDNFYYKICRHSTLCNPELSNDKRAGINVVTGDQSPINTWHQYNARMSDNPDIPEQYIQELKQTYSPEKYDTEVLGIFPRREYGGYLFTDESLDNIVMRAGKPQKSYKYVIAVDVGAGGDDTVYCVLQYNKTRGYVIYMKGYSTPHTPDIAKTIQDLYNKYNNKQDTQNVTVKIDGTGIGRAVIDQVEDLRIPVQEVVFSMSLKMAMFSQLLEHIQKNRVKLFKSKYVDYLSCIEQLSGIQIVNNNKVVSTTKHDDYAMALAIAIYDTFDNEMRLYKGRLDDLWGGR